MGGKLRFDAFDDLDEEVLDEEEVDEGGRRQVWPPVATKADQRKAAKVAMSPLAKPTPIARSGHLRDCKTCAAHADCIRSVARLGYMALDCELALNGDRADYGTKSIKGHPPPAFRKLRVLEVLRQADRPLTVSEMARQIPDLPKQRFPCILQRLVDQGVIERHYIREGLCKYSMAGR